MIIGVSGQIGSGKDQVGEYIQELTKVKERIEGPQGREWSQSNKWQIKKFAYMLKFITSKLTGIPIEDLEKREVKDSFLGDEWDYDYAIPFSGPDFTIIEKQMTVREFLQKLGTEAIREGLHPNTWVNALFAGYIPGDDWIITDTRFPNEAEAIKKRGGIVIRVNRPGIPKGTHPSETSLDNWEFDYIIENDGTLEDLKTKVSECLQHFGITTN